MSRGRDFSALNAPGHTPFLCSWAQRYSAFPPHRPGGTVDPRQAFGQPLVVHGGARVEDLVDRFQAGDGFADSADDFGVAVEEVEDVIRVALRHAA